MTVIFLAKGTVHLPFIHTLSKASGGVSSVIPKHNHFAHTTVVLCRTITTRHVASSSLTLSSRRRWRLAPGVDDLYCEPALCMVPELHPTSSRLVGRHESVVTVSCKNSEPLICLLRTYHFANVGSKSVMTRTMYNTHVRSLKNRFAIRIRRPGGRIEKKLRNRQ